jgi:hypothetical protein
MPRSSERGAVRRRYLFAMAEGMPVAPAGFGTLGCAGLATARRVVAPKSRAGSGGSPPTSRSGGSRPWRPPTSAGPYPRRARRLLPVRMRPVPAPAARTSAPPDARLSRYRMAGLLPCRMRAVPARAARPSALPDPACPGAGCPASRPAGSGSVRAPGPLPAGLPERGPAIAVLRHVRSRRSREHCPSGLGFYGVNPQWPGNVLHV